MRSSSSARLFDETFGARVGELLNNVRIGVAFSLPRSKTAKIILTVSTKKGLAYSPKSPDLDRRGLFLLAAANALAFLPHGLFTRLSRPRNSDKLDTLLPFSFCLAALFLLSEICSYLPSP